MAQYLLLADLLKVRIITTSNQSFALTIARSNTSITISWNKEKQVR
jgi:hypothetical protein